MDTALFRKTRSAPLPTQWLIRYGLALGASLVASLLTVLLVRHAEQGVFALFFAAVFVSARYGGFGPGLLATILTSAVATFAALPYLPSFASFRQEILPVSLYAAVSLLTTSILTKLRRTTENLREKEEHLSDFIEEATVGMNWVGEDGQILWANKAELRLLHYAAEDYIGHNLREFCVDPAQANDLLGRLARHESFQDFEVTLRASDESTRMVLLHSNVYSRDGRYVRARCFSQDVTARKAAEQALVENAVKFRAVFEQSLDAIAVSRDGIYSMVNPAHVQLYGYDRAEELIGTSIYALIAPAQRADVAARIQGRKVGEKVPASYETRGLRKDGTEFDIAVAVSVFELQGVHYTQAILRDITFQKQSEREMIHRANQQETVAQLGQQALGGEDIAILLPAAVERVQATLNVDYCEILEFIPAAKHFLQRASWGRTDADRALDVLAREVGSEVGYAFSKSEPVLIDENQPGGRFQISPILQRQAIVCGVCVRIVSRVRDYGILGIYSRTRRVFSSNEIHFVQAIAHVLASALDRQTADETLREREYLLRRVLDTNPNFIMVKDEAGVILLANEALAASYRLDLDQVVGRSQLELHRALGLNLAEVKQFLADDLEVIHTGRPMVMSESFTHLGGIVHWYSTHKLPFVLADNHRCVLIISENVTERKAARDELNRLNSELERRVIQRTAQLETANKELEAFSYSISHDLRAPLRAIQGFSQIVREDYGQNLDAEGLRLLEVIGNNTRRMGQLIEDLLAFSRVTRAEIAKVVLDVDALVRGVVQELTALEPGRAVQISIASLPPIRGDQALLNQVFVNLIINALKFTRGIPQPTIEIGCDQVGGEDIFFVRDNGVGFDMKYVNKLFKVFQRLHKIEQFEGTGVGLAIVHRIITRLGGRVWAEGILQGGATFFFALPREDRPRELDKTHENNSPAR